MEATAKEKSNRVRSFDPTRPKNPAERAMTWAAQRRAVTWFLVNVGGRIDPVLMKISGGRLKTTLSAPTVVLTHTGARSGRRRQTPLAYFTDGDDVILIASKGGAPNNPAWYHNLKANPEVELWNGGGGGRYRAHEAEGAERDRLWELTTTFNPGYASYQERATERTIPVIVCSPID